MSKRQHEIRNGSRALVVSAVLAGVLVIACAMQAPAQQIARVVLSPAVVAAGDTNDHLDLAVHRASSLALSSLRLSVYDAAGVKITSYAAAWFTTDTAVATVAAGTVRARGAGAASVGVVVSRAGSSRVSASLPACVVDTSSRLLIYPLGPVIARAGAGGTSPFLATLAGSSVVYPASCAHWAVSDSEALEVASSRATVNRGGVVTATAGRVAISHASTPAFVGDTSKAVPGCGSGGLDSLVPPPCIKDTLNSIAGWRDTPCAWENVTPASIACFEFTKPVILRARIGPPL